MTKCWIERLDYTHYKSVKYTRCIHKKNWKFSHAYHRLFHLQRQPHSTVTNKQEQRLKRITFETFINYSYISEGNGTANEQCFWQHNSYNFKNSWHQQLISCFSIHASYNLSLLTATDDKMSQNYVLFVKLLYEYKMHLSVLNFSPSYFKS